MTGHGSVEKMEDGSFVYHIHTRAPAVVIVFEAEEPSFAVLPPEEDMTRALAGIDKRTVETHVYPILRGIAGADWSPPAQ